MSALAVAPTLFDPQGGEPTLDDVIVGAWEGLAAQAVVPCPVCDGELEPVLDPDGRVDGGRCHGCGTTLC
jgi:ribosomal protein S27E